MPTGLRTEARAGADRQRVDPLLGAGADDAVSADLAEREAGRDLRALPPAEPLAPLPREIAVATAPPFAVRGASRRFSWEGSVREDLTTVGLSREVRSGTRLGLAALIAVDSRFRVRAGLTYGSRRYAAEWGSFSDPQGMFDGGPMPSLTDGVCRLVEAPLALNFHPLGLNRSGWFVGGGLRFRFVLDESLDFSYGGGVEGVVQGMDHVVRRFDVGAGELTGGYRFIASRRFAWSVGPALEIPLSGIGYGEVDVYTLGARFAFELR